MRLLNCVELDPRTVMMTVIESHSVGRWFWRVTTEQQRTYTFRVRVGRWHDGTQFVLSNDPRHMQLMALWAGWRDERALDAFVALDAPRFALPPKPTTPFPIG